MYANEETIQAIIDETLLRIPDKDEHKQFWKNTCIDITNFENKSIENLEPGAYIHYGALDSVYDLFPTNSFSANRNPETVAILTSCEMFVLEIERRYKQLEYQVSGDTYITFTDFAGKIYVYNATDIDGDTGNFSRQFDYLWRSGRRDSEGASGVKSVIPWYNQSETFRKYVDNEYIATTFGYNSIVHKKGSSEYVYSFPEETGTIALLENIPTKLSELTNDSGYITINSVGNGTLTITQNGTNKGIFSANQSSNSTIDITVPTKLSDLTNDSGYITIGSIGNGTLTITQNGTSKGTFSANQSGNSTIDIAVPTKTSDLTNDSGYTTNIGTVTQVKVGTTAYNPSSGIVSLPAYPTTLPASDVYAWAKASTKPSYTASEVGALALSGGTLSGRLTANGRISVATSGGSWISQKDINNAAIQITSKAATDGSRFDSIISGYSTDNSTWTIGILNNRIYFCRYVSTQVENTPTSRTYIDLINGYIDKANYANTAGSAPASDVYAWAKASTKPSYSYSEISGTPTIPTVNNGTLTIQKNGTSVTTFTANQSGNSTANITVPTKLSELTNDSGYITSSGSCANADALQNSTPDESTGASTIVKRTSAGQIKAVFYNMSGGENDINSFTSHVAFVSSDGWIRKTSKANFSTWLLTWTKLGSTTGNTQLSYTGTYTEFCIVLDLGFYAETFYFVASALGSARYYFGGTTNTADGSSWVLRASRSNTTYYFKVDRVHQDGTAYTSQVTITVYGR